MGAVSPSPCLCDCRPPDGELQANPDGSVDDEEGATDWNATVERAEKWTGPTKQAEIIPMSSQEEQPDLARRSQSAPACGREPEAPSSWASESAPVQWLSRAFTSASLDRGKSQQSQSGENFEAEILRRPTKKKTTLKEKIEDIITSISESAMDVGLLRSPSSISVSPSSIPEGMRASKSSGNRNVPSDYEWLQDPLAQLSRGAAADFVCDDVTTGEAFLPLFFVIGACPNSFCGMQAVMFVANAEGRLDFWWVKPSRKSSSSSASGLTAEIELETLRRHCKGTHKNTPGRSQAFYKPLADLFEQGMTAPGWRFGVEEVLATLDRPKVKRAFLQRDVDGNDSSSQKLYVLFFWQEDWTSNFFSRSKFIKGKILYQKHLDEFDPPEVFARQYEIVDDVIVIEAFEEASVDVVLPPDSVKILWERDS